MVETVETLAQRLTRLEKTVESITLHLSWVVNELGGDRAMSWKAGPLLETYSEGDNKQEAEIARKVLEQMGISGKPILAEELQARMVRNGIQPEGNEFSSAIIEEREK